MRKTLASLTLIGLMAALIGAGSLAYFSDTETSTGNTFTAGTLDLKVEDKNGNLVDEPLDLYWPAFINNMKPGDSEFWWIDVKNTGTVDGTLSLAFLDFAEIGGDDCEPELALQGPGIADLGSAVSLQIVYDDMGTPSGSYEYLYNGALNGFSSGTPASFRLEAGDTDWVWVSISLPASTGNRVMGDEVSFKSEFTLEQ